jgi:hypothetical protein
VPAHDQRVEHDQRQGEHRERPQRVLRAADEAELDEEVEAGEDDRDPAGPPSQCQEPEAGQADDD